MAWSARANPGLGPRLQSALEAIRSAVSARPVPLCLAAGAGGAFLVLDGCRLPILAGAAAVLAGIPLLPSLRRSGRFPAGPFLAAVLALLLGGLRMGAAIRPAEQWAERMDGREAVLAGVVESFPQAADGTGRDWDWSRFLLRADEGFLVRVEAPIPAPAYGTRLRMPVRFGRPDGARNPGGFDESALLLRRGVLSVAVCDRGTSVREEGRRIPSWPALLGQSVRDAVADAYARVLPPEPAALLSGMLLGDVRRLSERAKEDFRQAGLSHLTAVSGANVSFVLAPALAVAGRARLGRKARAAGLGLLLLLFGCVTGWQTSVTRAILMAAAVLAGAALHRRSDSLSALSLAGIAMLLLDPLVILDMGFYLSMAATAGLILFEPRVSAWLARGNDRLRQRSRFGMPPILTDTLAATLSAQAAVLPLTAAMQARLSPITILANLPVVPAAEAVTLSGALLALAAPILPGTGSEGAFMCGALRILCLPLSGLLSLILEIARIAAGIRFLEIPTESISPLLWLAGGTLLLAGARTPVLPAAFGRVLASVLAAAALLVPLAKPLAGPALRILFADVGQGDCTIVITRSGTCAVIDGGPGEGPSGSGHRVLLPLLSFYGVRRPDVVLLTHGHEDHAAGLSDLLQSRGAGLLVVPAGFGADTGPGQETEVDTDPADGGAAFREGDLSADMLRIAGQLKIPVFRADSNDTIRLDGETVLRILHPFPEDAAATDTGAGGGTRDPNGISLVVRIECGGFSALVCGDAPGAVEERLLDAGAPVAADVLRISHHGSGKSSGSRFLAGVHPAWAVISVGHNLYGHPSAAVLERLAATGCGVARTDRLGAVEIRVGRSGDVRLRTMIPVDEDG